MSETQKQFFELLENYPSLKGFWSTDENGKPGCDVDRIKSAKGLSQGERPVLKALTCIWMGGTTDTELFIDITDIAALSSDWREPLVNWMQYPFWP